MNKREATASTQDYGKQRKSNLMSRYKYNKERMNSGDLNVEKDKYAEPKTKMTHKKKTDPPTITVMFVDQTVGGYWPRSSRRGRTGWLRSPGKRSE